jgi:Zn-dependent M28 family amino/carboxypeptidase
VWKGADDNATTSVALLAIGRAFRAAPSARSALFVWHGSEELGLLGSRWYAMHPTVPRASIAAVINGDMIGRNHPDSAALMGVMAPNRNSRVLADMALDANRRVGRFVIDSSWDAPGHPEGLFQRSDHWPYVLQRIPVIYFSTALSADYHTPRDAAPRIDYAKLTRMTRWMYATGWAAANAAARPALDAPAAGRD